MRYYPINEEAAHTAWSMNHMGTFNSDEIDYMREVDQAYDIAEETAERCPDQRDAAIELADSFAQRLADWFNKKYRATQGTVLCVDADRLAPANNTGNRPLCYEGHEGTEECDLGTGAFRIEGVIRRIPAASLIGCSKGTFSR